MAQPQDVKLLVGMLSQERELFDHIEEVLTGLLGPVDLKSPLWPWSHTAYYEKEMGKGLMRQFLFFHKLVGPERLGEIKQKTGEIEGSYLNDTGGRRINLDPGYLNTAKLVLASTKDFSHRIYLGQGIFGEVTLFHSKGQFRTFPYTFPDYRTHEYRELFEQARKIYKEQIKGSSGLQQGMLI